MSYWDKISGVYDLAEKINGGVYNEMLRITTKLTPWGAEVLDCAAGTGELSIAAAKRAYSVLCTDSSDKMLAVAEKKAVRHHYDNIRFEKRDIFSLADADETYDVVIAGNVLHLLSEPEKALKELARVTKKGGKILVPCFTDTTNNKFIVVYKKLGFDPKHDFTSDSYAKFINAQGLGHVKVKVLKGLIPCTYAVIYKK